MNMLGKRACPMNMLKKTKHVLGHGWFFFWKKKKNLKKKTMYVLRHEWNIFSTFFFSKKKTTHVLRHGWVFFSHQKKNPEKNTQACVWNMRGSLPLLTIRTTILKAGNTHNFS